jgi:hypothetical protein
VDPCRRIANTHILAANADRAGDLTRLVQFGVLEREALGPSRCPGEFVEERDIVGAFRRLAHHLVDLVSVRPDENAPARSLADFAKIVEILDARAASFVSVTQQFNTTTSMGRLTLNILLSFAQFEREVIGERICDKP